MTANELWEIIYELRPEYKTLRIEGVHCDLISATESAALTAFLAKHDDEKMDRLRSELIYIRDNGLWSWCDEQDYDVADINDLELVEL